MAFRVLDRDGSGLVEMGDIKGKKDAFFYIMLYNPNTYVLELHIA
jgi:hypothetical protein